jgi:hypothetical protein
MQRKLFENRVSMPRGREESTSILLNKPQNAAFRALSAEIVRMEAEAFQNDVSGRG